MHISDADRIKSREIPFQEIHPDPHQAATAARFLKDVDGILDTDPVAPILLRVTYDVLVTTPPRDRRGPDRAGPPHRQPADLPRQARALLLHRRHAPRQLRLPARREQLHQEGLRQALRADRARMSGRSAGALAAVFSLQPPASSLQPPASSMWTAASTLISALERVAPDARELIARQPVTEARPVDGTLRAMTSRRPGAGGWRLAAGGWRLGAGGSA
jgi:hypothetical protein